MTSWLSLDQNTLKKEWEGVTRRITAEEFTNVFRPWYEGHQKCIEIGSSYVK
jgi:hypothetical protein